MRQAQTRVRRLLSAASLAAALLVALSLAVVVHAQASSQLPVNDNYLASLNLNQPHTALNRVDTLADTRDITTATVQSDIFSPQQQGGPTEVTGCNGVSEGRTIWYDLYPDASGLVRIRTSADFGTVIAIMPFDPKSLLPENAGRRCAVNEVSQTRELFYPVKAGGFYTVQIGGVGASGGVVESLFDYLVKPQHLQADATLTAQPLGDGVRVVNLSVSAPSKARVLVRCTKGCKGEAKTARVLAFSKLRGSVLANGSALKIYVTAKNDVGAYIEYKIHGGSFTKTQRCLAPGSSKPSRCE
jgi:hypothetical protein